MLGEQEIVRQLWTPRGCGAFAAMIERQNGTVWSDFYVEIDSLVESSGNPRAVSGTARDSSVGRNGWTYDLDGMDIKWFNEQNPVVLAAHHQIVPATLEPAAIARIERVSKREGMLVFKNMTFDETPLAEAWLQAIRRGTIRMVSVGAMPHEWEMVEEPNKKTGKTDRHILVTRSELLEISPVPIGANRAAFIDPRTIGREEDAQLPRRVAEMEAALRELRDIISCLETSESADEESYGDATFPDAAFVIEVGAPRTSSRGGANASTPQAYRHLPHHSRAVRSPDDNKTVDISHLRNALARVNQVKPKIEAREKFIARAKAHLSRHARALLKSHQEDLCILESIEGLSGEPREAGVLAAADRLREMLAENR